MKATFVRSHTENIARNIVTFWFRPEKPLDHIAGQFVEITLPHADADNRHERRWFTLSSSPTELPLVSITTKFAEKSSSFKAALEHLKPDDQILISDPMGDFVLPMDDRIPLVFVAISAGITPFRSIVKFLHDTKQQRTITFMYATTNEQELVFQDLFEQYDMNLTITLKQPASTWDGGTGKLTGQRILDAAKPKGDALIYIAGPELVVERLNEELTQLGIEKSRLVSDFFHGYSNV